jgi:hypothetical protein
MDILGGLPKNVDKALSLEYELAKLLLLNSTKKNGRFG